MPMMPPGGMGGAGGMNSPSSERPDSSGLLGNIKQPWVSPPPEGIGNPNANGEAPPLSSANWAPPPGASGGLGDGPGGLGDGLGGTGGTGGPDAIKGLGESDLPKMPDPIGEQNQNNQQQQQTPGAGTPPMMPPGGMGGAGGMNAPSAERPDSSGLLGNVDKPWLSEIPGGVGDPTSQGETPPLSSAEWAPPPGGAVDPGGVGSGPGDSIGDGFKGIGESDGPKLPDPIGSQNENQQQLPQTPGAGTPPMMPPGGMGGAGGMNAPSAERPDSAGLLGNVDRPWLSEMPGGVGDPTSQGETPRSESAGWAPPPGGTGGDSVGFTGIGETDGPKLPDPIGEQNENNQQQLPQQPGSGTPPMMPPGGMGGAGGMNQSSAERPDAAGLLGGVQQPWTASTPGSVGDPNAFGDTPSSESAAWASPPNGETTSAELPDAIGADQQQTPGTPMVPPGGMGGAGAQNQSSAERPDSAGLLGGVQQPWVAGTVDGVGAPSAHGETPPLQAASWADSSAVDTHSEQGTTSEAAGVDQQSPTNTGWGTSPQPGWGTAGEPRREERAAPPAVPQGGGEADDIVRIAVVQPVDAEDTSAWDVGTAEFLPGLLPVGRVAEDRAEEIGTDYLERSAEPWRTEPAAEPEPVLSTYQRLRGGSAEILFDDIPMCGDGPEPEPEPSEKDASSAGDGDEAEEEEERTMADLLRQDDSAWGAPGGRRSSGVLE
ncbi:hypothetical protein BJY18_005079 [Amycolatopsis jiangsuensis]|uniref:Uncharacterized protein n=2 Tax=Amycolatopsis jiangsuensis TaxID=1181879 RepID=A0A840J2T9_9PSEU|nr:hypothetical protein [Amycolatopsis jiangsuensis]